ncbi:MAG: class II glutamine amidotransferase [Streptosporangiaceae bacterium]
MCEILAVRWAEARPFAAIAENARAMEYYGSGKFGWGVAWLEDGQVRRHRYAGRMEEDEAVAGYLDSVQSTKFVIHFRRPTLLSTIHLANTQPFVTAAADLAFCHNGLFADFESYRGAYAERLTGVADSEIGFCMLQDMMGSGVPVSDALAMVYEKLGGQANLAALAADGTLSLYSNHERNRFWTFREGEADIAATELHSPDGSLFKLIFPDATDRAVVAESAVL